MAFQFIKTNYIIQIDPPEHFCNYEIFSWTTTIGATIKGAISQKGPVKQIHFYA